MGVVLEVGVTSGCSHESDDGGEWVWPVAVATDLRECLDVTN